MNARDLNERDDAPSAPDMRSFAFGSFVLLEATRSLFEGQRRVNLPPRYFALLVLLIERRDRVVTKDDLYEQVWKDEIVTEGAIAQGIRFLRKSLGDDARDPRFIRTAAKFGYQWIAVLNDFPSMLATTASPPATGGFSAGGSAPRLFPREVPVRTEIATAFRIALERYAAASLGSAIAGALAGSLGSLLLVASSSPANPARVIVVLGLLGFVIGGLGGLGVGFGLSFAESLIRKSRALLLSVAGAISGALIGGVAHSAFAETIIALFGRAPQAFGGAYEGLWIGALTGFGYGLATKDLLSPHLESGLDSAWSGSAPSSPHWARGSAALSGRVFRRPAWMRSRLFFKVPNSRSPLWARGRESLVWDGSPG